jgi:hypothetical protein
MKIFNANTAASPQGTEVTFKTGGTYNSPTYTGGVGVTGANSDFSSYGLTNLKPGDAFLYAFAGNVQISDFSGSKKISFSNGVTDSFSVDTATKTATFAGNIVGNTNGFTIGYRDMPQVTAANVTLALTDAGKHYYDTSTAPTTVTIPNNANVAFATGTVISFVNDSIGNLIIGRQNAVSLYLGGNATSAGRTITSYGVATLMKVATNTWYINGTGVV